MDVRDRGFTLVELAIVMVVVGLLLGLGIGMAGSLLTMTRTRETRETVTAAVDGLVSLAAGSNNLPDAAAFPAAVRSPRDAWGRDLIYLFDADLSPALPTKDTICGRRLTGLSLVTAAPAATIANVAFVILSRGDDAAVDTTMNGTLNGGGINGAVTGSGTATGIVTLDGGSGDIVSWVTIDELRTRTGCQGGAIRIVNNELPYGTVASPYPSVGGAVAISVDGGATPGTLRWCLEAPAAPLPAGLNFNLSLAGAVRTPPATTCAGPVPLAENNWVSSPTLTISGTPAAATQGSYSFTLYVRDNNDAAGGNDNIAAKSFVLTINP